MAILDDIKGSYLRGSMLVRLILINIAVFVLLRLILLGAMLFHFPNDGIVGWIGMPCDLRVLAHRPWTVLTYMFAHFDWMHILFNMLWLYWLGRIFMEFFSPKQLTGLYLLGGFGGAILYLVVYQFLPHNAPLVGASAAVIAIVVATAVYTPDYKIGLLFLGEVSIKWVAIATIAIDLLSLESQNAGGSIAHIGGAIVGALYALRIKHGRDITRPLNSVIDGIVGLFSGRTIKLSKFGKPIQGKAHDINDNDSRANRPADTVSEEELDTILKKIKAAGYDALSDAEKDKLFKASRRRTP